MLLVPGLSRRCALSNHLFRTIGFIGTGNKIFSDTLVVELRHPWTKHHLHAVFLDILHNFQLAVCTKMRQSDCTQRCDVTVLSETFGCFRNVSGKLKIYTFLTLINPPIPTLKIITRITSPRGFPLLFPLHKSQPMEGFPQNSRQLWFLELIIE